MAIDTSIYGNIKQPEAPDFIGAMQKGMALSHLAMQSQQAQRAMAVQQASREAYAKNIGPDGQLNEQAYLSALGSIDPNSRFQAQEQMGKANKEYAEGDKSKTEAAQKILSISMPAMQGLAQMTPDQRAQAFPDVIKRLEAQGVPIHNVPMAGGQPVYDDGWFRQAYATGSQMADHLANLKTQSEIQQAPAKLNSELYGSRSPNAELTSQYTADVKPIRSSQMAMRQMIDNYNHPSPQGDASLILNAFKIKFPTAPDVNSLKELSESQSASDHWKNMAYKGLEGGLDQPTRDNLMRDGVSTFRANTETLRDYQDKYKARAQAQNVGDTSFLAEPGVDKTYADAMKLQDKIGPYVPPAERGGIMAGANRFLSGLVESAGQKKASAAETNAPTQGKSQPNVREAGSKVSADEVAQYAVKHKMKLSDAQKTLRGFGYAVD